MPALHLLLFYRGVYDDADGEEVIDALEWTSLLLHLLPDRVYRLGTSLDVKLDAGLRKSLTDRADKALDVSVAALFCLAQLSLDMVIGVVLQVFQRQVL